jgi:transglutaminase-like putative cysteine protease
MGRRLPEGLSTGDQIRELVAHLLYWIRQALTGGTGRDVLIFVILLSGLSWILGYNAAWNTYRRLRVWRAIIPTGVVTLIIAYYYAGPAPLMNYVTLYLFFALLYLARSHIVQREEAWQRERVAYDNELRFSALRAGVAVTLIVLAVAWVLPSAPSVSRLRATWRRLSNPWRTVEEEWQRLFTTVRGNPVSGLAGPFGPSMALGGSQKLQDVLLMDVAAPRQGRYYWRGAVYAYYSGNRWDALETESIMLIPERQPPGIERTALRRVVTQTITSYTPGRRTLAGASQLVSIDREAEATIDLTGNAPLDFIRVSSVVPLDAGEQYTVLSHVSDADATSLRQASTDYPEWAQQRYTQLPLSLPARVRLLAEEITAGADTPYDRALAIEQYLRRSITYTLTPPSLPEGRDYVDFLLFDSQRDYCNGYASSMVVLARSVGIPARLAVGYAEGEHDAERGVFRVRETNAHSWPELYFPRYGWIEFEPTASEAPYVRPDRLDELSPEEQWPLGAGVGVPLPLQERGVLRLREFDEEFDWEITPLAARRRLAVWPWAVGLALIALVAAVWWAVENLGFWGLPPVERAYARALRLGNWLGRPMGTSDTPWEWAYAVSAIAPRAREPVEHIVDLYVRSRFARGDTAAPEAGAAWRHARPALWQCWLGRVLSFARRREA